LFIYGGMSHTDEMIQDKKKNIFNI
jgi:hypothetical protein